MSASENKVELATAADLQSIEEVERLAASRFGADTLPVGLESQTVARAILAEAIAEARLFVVRSQTRPVVGFALAATIDDDGLIEEVDVHPDFGSQGIGRALVEAVCDWASGQGHAHIVLSTFRDVAWNAPFYARAGFREIEAKDWTPAQRSVRRKEGEAGFDLKRRIWMSRSLRGPGSAG